MSNSWKGYNLTFYPNCLKWTPLLVFFFWLIFCLTSVTDIGNWWHKFDIKFLQDFPLKEKKIKNSLNILLVQLHVGDFKMNVFYLFYRSSKSPLICYNCNQGYNIWSREAHGSIHTWGQGLSIISFTHTVQLYWIILKTKPKV